jgi:hypothetical protein
MASTASTAFGLREIGAGFARCSERSACAERDVFVNVTIHGVVGTGNLAKAILASKHIAGVFDPVPRSGPENLWIRTVRVLAE